MDYTPIHNWLRLPPGPWPPDHYTLLGLSPDDSTAPRVESRVLELMDVLRRHQLRHPELVTEGMNRLAQALNCLTDSEERTTYDAGRNSSPAQQERLQPRTAVVPTLVKFRAPPTAPEVSPDFSGADSVFDLDDDDQDEGEASGLDAPDATLILEVPFSAGLQPPLILEELPKEQPEPEPLPAPEEVVEAEVVAEQTEFAVSNRRWLYHRLAVLRRCLRGWDAVASVLADPNEHLDRPNSVFTFLQNVADLQPEMEHLRNILGGAGRHGTTALALLRLRLPSDAVRNLLPDQRAAVAIDWRRGRIRLEREQERLREICRTARPKRVKFFRSAWRWVNRNPEAILIVILALAVLAALGRGRGHH